MKIIEVTEGQCMGWIQSKPELADRAFSSKNPKFAPAQSKYIAVVSDTDVICMVKHEWFSDYCIQFHAYLNPRLWSTKYLTICQNLLECYYRDCGALSILCMCPTDCLPAIKGSKKVGFKECGKILHATEWKGKVSDLIVLQKELY